MITTRRFSLLAAALLVLLGGCATRPINPPITQADPTTGYRFESRQAKLQGQGQPGHPRLLGRRHACCGLFLRGPGVPPQDRGCRAEGQQGPLARRSQHDHRRVGRQFHRAGLWPVRRQAVCRLRATLPEARCAGRDRRPRLQPDILGRSMVDGLGPFRIGGPAVRRNPVQRRDVRRSQPRRRPD